METKQPEQPKIREMRVAPEPKFKLSPEQLEEVRQHSLGELENLKIQVQKTVQERAEHERRLNELVGIQNQLQGAIHELQAFSLACGIDLSAEEQKRVAKPSPA